MTHTREAFVFQGKVVKSSDGTISVRVYSKLLVFYFDRDVETIDVIISHGRSGSCSASCSSFCSFCCFSSCFYSLFWCRVFERLVTVSQFDIFCSVADVGCFGTYFAHIQTCDDVRVQSATQWTASVHTLHMSKPVTTFVFKVLRNGLLRYILYTCPNL